MIFYILSDSDLRRASNVIVVAIAVYVSAIVWKYIHRKKEN